ncbi:MAG: YigZ family protein [Clostridia bacterium]|nr:YigZ family protein [Clostridia bacterium]
MESYTTVEHAAKYEYEDRKSVFIGEAFPVSCEADALAFIARVKKKYPDARHHVYAYVLRENSTMRFSDDREPQGTAGMPVLDVIRKSDCTDVLIVVVRYFGGILLGTGGLVRAYTAAASGALREANVVTYDVYSELQMSVTYSDYQKILSALSECGFRCGDTKFSENVLLAGKIKATDTDNFIKKITEITSGRCKINIIGEKFDF